MYLFFYAQILLLLLLLCLFSMTNFFSVNIRVFDRDGIEFAIRGKVGDNVMMLAQYHEVDVEGEYE